MKAILVINDMPNECVECPLHSVAVDEAYCNVMKDTAFGVDKPTWCPLKPLPEKLHVEVNQIEDIMPSEFNIDKLTLKIKLDTDKIFAFG